MKWPVSGPPGPHHHAISPIEATGPGSAVAGWTWTSRRVYGLPQALSWSPHQCTTPSGRVRGSWMPPWKSCQSYRSMSAGVSNTSENWVPGGGGAGGVVEVTPVVVVVSTGGVVVGRGHLGCGKRCSHGRASAGAVAMVATALAPTSAAATTTMRCRFTTAPGASRRATPAGSMDAAPQRPPSRPHKSVVRPASRAAVQ